MIPNIYSLQLLFSPHNVSELASCYDHRCIFRAVRNIDYPLMTTTQPSFVGQFSSAVFNPVDFIGSRSFLDVFGLALCLIDGVCCTSTIDMLLRCVNDPEVSPGSSQYARRHDTRQVREMGCEKKVIRYVLLCLVSSCSRLLTLN